MLVVWTGATADVFLEPLASLADSAPFVRSLPCYAFPVAGGAQVASRFEDVSHVKFARIMSASAGIGVTVIDAEALIGQS